MRWLRMLAMVAALVVGAGTARAGVTLSNVAGGGALVDTGTVVTTSWIPVLGASKVAIYISDAVVTGVNDSTYVDSIVDIRIQVSNDLNPASSGNGVFVLGTSSNGNKNLSISTRDSTYSIYCDHSLYSLSGGINAAANPPPLMLYSIRRVPIGGGGIGSGATSFGWAESGTFDRIQWVRARFRAYGRVAYAGVVGSPTAKLPLNQIRYSVFYP